MSDISGFGIKVRITASVTFPNGVEFTQFADDADPIDIPSQQLRDKAMGINGDLVTWAKAVPIPMTLNLIPGSEDDKNAAVLAEANRTGKGKRAVNDIITATITYPDESTVTLTQGAITDAMMSSGVASAGRLKTKPYAFVFENKN